MPLREASGPVIVGHAMWTRLLSSTARYRAVLGTARQFPAVLAYAYGSIERVLLTRRSRHGHVAQIGRIDVAECHERDAIARDGRARLAAETDVRRHRAFDRFAVRPPDGMKHILPRG